MVCSSDILIFIAFAYTINMCAMPRLSIFKPEKSNDYKFFDRNIKELFQVGGTDIYIHKYMGPHDQGETNDATQPKRAVIDQMSIQDLLLLDIQNQLLSLVSFCQMSLGLQVSFY